MAKWIAELGVTDAPIARERIRTALDFFALQMPELPRALRVAFLKGMDLGKPVRAAMVYPPFEVAAFRQCNQDPLKLYYTKTGTGVDGVGRNPARRSFTRFRVANMAPALLSVYVPAPETWTDDHRNLGGGGGVQYLFPAPFRYLELIQ